ncbi:MAG: DUF4468 domain-containing protein [Prevotellaceae bacterium]|nr:DUF4468 domain-containing protein [Prevotellaceae bacterium]
MNLKNVFLLLTAILLAGCSTIKIVSVEQYRKNITIQDKYKDDLFILSNCWLLETFVATDNVIEFQNQEAGKIIGKCMLSTANTSPVWLKPGKKGGIKCLISIDVGDKAVKIKFTPPDNLTETDAIDLKIRWRALADEFETYLNRETVEW